MTKEKKCKEGRIKQNTNVKLCYMFPSPLGHKLQAFYLFIMCTFTVQNDDDMTIKVMWSLSSRNRI